MASIPSTWLFCLSVESLSRMAPTAASSAGVATGALTAQVLFSSARFKSAISAPALLSLISRAVVLSNSNSFSLFSFASAFCSSSRPTQAAANAIASATAAIPPIVNNDLVICFMAMASLTS